MSRKDFLQLASNFLLVKDCLELDDSHFVQFLEDNDFPLHFPQPDPYASLLADLLKQWDPATILDVELWLYTPHLRSFFCGLHSWIFAEANNISSLHLYQQDFQSSALATFIARSTSLCIATVWDCHFLEGDEVAVMDALVDCPTLQKLWVFLEETSTTDLSVPLPRLFVRNVRLVELNITFQAAHTLHVPLLLDAFKQMLACSRLLSSIKLKFGTLSLPFPSIDWSPVIEGLTSTTILENFTILLNDDHITTMPKIAQAVASCISMTQAAGIPFLENTKALRRTRRGKAAMELGRMVLLLPLPLELMECVLASLLEEDFEHDWRLICGALLRRESVGAFKTPMDEYRTFSGTNLIRVCEFLRLGRLLT